MIRHTSLNRNINYNTITQNISDIFIRKLEKKLHNLSIFVLSFRPCETPKKKKKTREHAKASIISTSVTITVQRHDILSVCSDGRSKIMSHELLHH